MSAPDEITPPSPDEIRKKLEAELEETNRALREVTLMLEQSKGEVGKLSQRNAAITAHLQQVQTQGASASPEEVRMAYDAALDAQQRLFVMRGQLEKLQSDQTHLTRLRASLENALQVFAGSASTSSNPAAGGKGTVSSMEMVIQAQEAERQRLSRQMHDGPAQALSNFILQTEIAMRLMDVDVSRAREELLNLKTSAMGTFQKVRNFIFELRPMMLDDLGLAPTVKRYADAFREQTGLEVNATVSGQEKRLESYIEVMIFRAIQELLGNASRHSQASLVKLLVDIGENVVKVVVDDNGKGFDPEALKNSSSLGLNLIRERVETVGGAFDLDSVIGRGTRVTFSVPARPA